MKIIRGVVNTLIATVGGSMAGGAAGGAVMALSNVPDLHKAASIFSAVLGILFYLFGAVMMAFLGLVGGMMFGFIPTLVLGSVLSFLRNVPPFGHCVVWAIAGALAGIAIYLWTPYGSPSVAHDKVPWALGWAIGGAASMLVYWSAGIGREFAKVVR